jgi:hypothetical protein
MFYATVCEVLLELLIYFLFANVPVVCQTPC